MYDYPNDFVCFASELERFKDRGALEVLQLLLLLLLLLNECVFWNTHVPMLEQRALSLATEEKRYQAFDEL